ncbi:MAG: chemotaxis protein CheW [Myxococcales bacterium]
MSLSLPQGRPATESAAPDGGHEVVSLCAFEVNGGSFAIDLRRVREILRPTKITKVPKAPAYLEGVVHLRGSVIPVVDLRKRLGNDAPGSGPLNRLVIAWIGRRVIGLLVDRVRGVLRLPRGELLPAPDLWLEKGARLFVGACRGTSGELGLLLNLRALLASDEPVEAAAVERLRAGAAPPGSRP